MSLQPNEHIENEETLIIHCGKKNIIPNGDVSMDAIPAIHMSASYLFDSAESLLDVSKGEGQPGYVYRRYGNENTIDLSLAISQLEHAKESICISCGMGAISTAFLGAGVLQGTKKILGPYSCYGTTYTLLKTRFADIATCEFSDMGNTEATLEHIRRLKPDVLYLEMSAVVPEIAILVKEAKRVNPTVLIMIDNTYVTPLLVKPLDLGVDVVIHSATKYINGHGDALAGVICSNNLDYMNAVKGVVIEFGTMLSPWDAWLVQRGLRTLGVRMEAIGSNALKIARYLSTHSCIASVTYPGLPSHPQFQAVLHNSCRHYTEVEIQTGFPFSGMLSFEIKVCCTGTGIEGDVEELEALGLEASKLFLNNIKLISNMVSLGDVMTLARAPGLSSQQMPLTERKMIGLKSTTIRLSVGMENWKDICDDINQSLEIATRGKVNSVGKGAGVEQLDISTATGTGATSTTVDSADTNTNPSPVPATPTAIPIPSASQVLKERTLKLQALYTQMRSITQEIEQIQSDIKSDTELLLG